MKSNLLLLVLTLAVSGFGQISKFSPAPNPAGPGSMQPNWAAASDGGAILSWLEPEKAEGLASLKFAVHHGANWSEVRTIAAHRHFFRHPAEIPEVIQAADGAWLAHWVEMPQPGSEAEYVYVSSSRDGLHWTVPVMAHKDRSAVQHGLASIVSSGNGEASILWLQGQADEDAAVSLMRTVVNAQGKPVKEEKLDEDVCACCPTAVVKTAKGLLVAYRDHSSEDIRDIAVIRLENGKWTPSKIVNADKWQLNACPTNAAAAAAKGDHVAISWFTGADSKPRVQMVFSEDDGATFSKPVVVSTGRAFGYTNLTLDDDGSAIVSWLEEGTGTTRVLLREISASGAPGAVVEVAKGGRQELGYPRVFHSGAETWVTWGDAKSVQTAMAKK